MAALCLHPAQAARTREAPRQERVYASAEWGSLRAVWQELTQHSSGKLWSPSEFDQLQARVLSALSGLDTLVPAKLLSAGDAAGLRELTLARCQHIRASTYQLAGSRLLRDVQQAAYNARGEIELYAQWLQTVPAAGLSPLEGKPVTAQQLAGSARRQLGRALELLQRVQEFEAERARREAALRAREQKGQPVDWVAFQVGAGRRAQAILAAFAPGRPVKVRAPLARLADYAVALSLPSASASPVPPDQPGG